MRAAARRAWEWKNCGREGQDEIRRGKRRRGAEGLPDWAFSDWPQKVIGSFVWLSIAVTPLARVLFNHSATLFC